MHIRTTIVAAVASLSFAGTGLGQADFELVDSGQLTDDDKREIKKMFAESLGGGDVDEKIREANKNRDQLDAQAREALDLLNKLMV